MHPVDTTHSDARRIALWKRVVLLVVLGGVLVALVASDVLSAAFLRILALAEPIIAAHPVLGAVLFVLLAALSAMLAFFSSAVLVPAAVQAWGIASTVFLLWLGWTLGGFGAYVVARFVGRPAVARLASDEALVRYEGWVSERASFGTVLLFQLALPSEVPGYVLGLVRCPITRFVPALMLAEIPFATATVYVGAGLVERRLPLLVGVFAVAVLISLTALVLLRRQVRAAKREDAPEDDEGARLRAAEGEANRDGPEER